MRAANLSAEQQEHLDRHIAGIGHNQGPALLDHADTIVEKAAQHHRLHAEVTGIRVMFDMLRSDVSGEYVIPATTVAYLAVGVGLVAAITGFSIATQPFSTLLLDAVVVAFIVKTLHGEMGQYVDWRVARDPAYEAVKRELFGGGAG